MKWTPGGTSEDVEDRRDEGSGGGGGGFGGFGMPHIGIGGIIILLILSFIFKRNLFTLLGSGGPAPGAAVNRPVPDPQRNAAQQPTVQFVSFVLDDAQKTWTQILSSQGLPYRHAKLVLFRNATYSGCGSARASTGPFYCPADEKIYIDLDFYDELKSRFGAPGQFAQAYVLAHELGHHIQKLTGVESKVQHLQEQNPGSKNSLSVRLELQADCLAGVWAHTTE
ncbi:MAG: neutral zinc metallopeptidase, partial [Terriglobales bacterium]